MKKVIILITLILGIEVKGQIVGGFIPLNSTKSATMGGLRVNGTTVLNGSTTIVGTIASPTVAGSTSTLNLFSSLTATTGLIQIGNPSNTPTINIGNASVNTTSLGNVRFGQGTSKLDVGEGGYNGAGYITMWSGQTTPTSSNPFLQASNNFLILNNGTSSGGQIQFENASVIKALINSSLTSTTNSLNVGAGTFGTSSLHLARFSKGTATVDIGQISSGFPGIWLQQSTPTTTNYNFAGDANTLYLNGSSSIDILTVGIARHRFNATGLKLGGASNAAEALDVTGNGTVSANFSANNFRATSTKSVVSGSTSGSITVSQPFQGSSYKKVIVYCSALVGTAAYTFPTAYTNTPALLTTNGPAASVVTGLSTTTITITGATTTGYIILEGY